MSSGALAPIPPVSQEGIAIGDSETPDTALIPGALPPIGDIGGRGGVGEGGGAGACGIPIPASGSSSGIIGFIFLTRREE